VKSLLEFSRQAKPGNDRVNVNTTVADTLSLIGNQSLFFNIEFTLDCTPDLPPITVDRTQLQQVFMNLLVNAGQAMERGRITLTTAYRADDGQVEISIRDTGRGIAPEHLAHIFDPFFTTKESSHGTGLGLSIAYGIVTKHGGTISVQSVLGEGTTFKLRFPAQSSEIDLEIPRVAVASA
jgi:two-component system NtrC family sensor kinase